MYSKPVSFGIPFLMGILVAIFAPVNILEFPLADAVYRAASYIYPSVKKMKGDYEMGQVAKFYYSSMWMMAPIMFVGAYHDLQRRAEFLTIRCREKKATYVFFFLLFFPSCAFVLWNFTFEGKDIDDVRTFLSFHSRWGMIFFGGLVPASAAIFAAMTAFGYRIVKRVLS